MGSEYFAMFLLQKQTRRPIRMRHECQLISIPIRLGLLRLTTVTAACYRRLYTRFFVWRLRVPNTSVVMTPAKTILHFLILARGCAIETDTQTHRHTDTQTDTQTHTHTQTHRHTDTQTHRRKEVLRRSMAKCAICDLAGDDDRRSRYFFRNFQLIDIWQHQNATLWSGVSIYLHIKVMCMFLNGDTLLFQCTMLLLWRKRLGKYVVCHPEFGVPQLWEP